MRLQDYYDSVEVITEIDVSNYNNLEKPVYTKRYNGYLFYVDNVEFLFKGNHINNNEWIIKFGVHDSNGTIDISMTNKKEANNTIAVLKNVVYCLSLFTEKYKPNKISLVAESKSRQKMYERMVRSLLKKSEWQYYGNMETKKSETDNSITWIITKR